ncbi:MAG: DUF7594 domain-containing protein [Ardenticatenaceae bacterium]
MMREYNSIILGERGGHQRSFLGRFGVAFLCFLSMWLFLFGFLPGEAVAQPEVSGCNSSGPISGAYTVTLCFDTPGEGATLSGVEEVMSSVVVSGTSPGVRRMVFYLDGEDLLTDYEAPYTFELPSDHFVDDTVALAVEARMRDGFITDRTTITVTLSNTVTTPPVNSNTFAPYTATVTPGEPFVLAATGDGASGRAGATAVTDLIVNRDPDMFLYLGDVYQDGTYAEFFNWYGTQERFFGQFRDITNPVLGDHEYNSQMAQGYLFYWDNPPDFYSFDSAGWHVIVLNSNSMFDEFEPGTPQYDWLEQDLNDNTSHCTLVASHNPRYSVGPKGGVSRLEDMWGLMVQEGVDVVLSGDDHSYQRWEALDENGDPDPQGVTQFVAGAGGQGVQAFVMTDTRVLVGYDMPPIGFGSLFMNLNPDGMAFQYVNIDNEVLDFAVMPCSGAPADTTAPSAPSNLSAPSNSNGEVNLTWDAAIDNTGVLSYTIYRNGVEVDRIDGASLSYTDHSALLDTVYTYTVDALDAASNRSALSNAVHITTADTRLLMITPVADSYVNANSATNNYGSATVLRTDATPDLHAYLRFEVPTLVGIVTDAKLRVFANTTSGIGYSVHEVADNSWDETTINFTNAPSVGGEVGASGGFSANSWSETSVPSLDVQEGALSVALLTTSNSNISYSSRQGDQPPELQIELSPSGASMFTFTPVADTYVNASNPNRNYGSSSALRTDASPEINSYMRFDVQKLTGFIESATLRVYANSGSTIGYDLHHLSDNSWGESSTTFNNAPAIGSILAPSGAFSSNSWTEIDVTNVVTEGQISFALSSTSNGAVSYASREGANPPQLLIVTGDTPPPPPQAGTFTFNASADAYVKGNNPSNNYGGSSLLRADLSPETRSYVQFDVQDVVGTIDSATLRIFANSGSSVGIEVSSIITTTSWEESSITFSNAPTVSTFITSTGSFAGGTWLELDISSLVTAEGLVNVALTTSSNTAISLSSREGTNPPELVIDTVESTSLRAPAEAQEPAQIAPDRFPLDTEEVAATGEGQLAAPELGLASREPFRMTMKADQANLLLEATPRRNWGHLEELPLHTRAGGSTRVLYRFELPSLAADEIQSAHAYFWVTQASNSPIAAHRITEAWTEDNVTWERYAAAYDNQAVGSFTPSQSEQFVSVDITPLIQDWLNGTHPNHGLMLIGSPNSQTMLTSRAWYAETKRPYIEIHTVDNAQAQTIYLPMLAAP